MKPRDPRRAVVAFVLAVLCLIGVVVAGQKAARGEDQPARPHIVWTKVGPGFDYYAWVSVDAREKMGWETIRTMCHVSSLRGDLGERGIGCVAMCLRGAVVPAFARRVSDDEEVGRVIESGDFCWIYSTSTWAQALWAPSTYRGDSLTHLEHEKKHVEGYMHQSLAVLRGEATR